MNRADASPLALTEHSLEADRHLAGEAIHARGVDPSYRGPKTPIGSCCDVRRVRSQELQRVSLRAV